MKPTRAATADTPSRIFHGDCLEVLPTLPDGFADAIVTDPPYGIDYQATRRKDRRRWLPKIANDRRPFIWFLREAFRVLKDQGAMLCFVRFDVEPDFRRAMALAGFSPKAQLIWDKVAHGVGDCHGDFAPRHENIIFAAKGRFTFPGGRPTTVLRHPRVNPRDLVHPNEKPVALLEQLIGAVTKPGEIVLDPFLGAGATACAAQRIGRRFVGVELDGKYVDIATARVALAVNGSAEQAAARRRA